MDRPIEASTTIPAPFDDTRALLAEDPGPVLCETCTEEERRERRFRAALAVDLGGGMSVQQEVTLRVGTVQPRDDSVVVPVTWEATGHHHMLPSLDGVLEVSDAGGATRLSLRGSYRLPMGAVGRFGDAVGGRRLARLSVGAFVEQLGARLDEEVRRRTQARTHAVIPLDPLPAADVWCPPLSPEHYIG